MLNCFPSQIQKKKSSLLFSIKAIYGVCVGHIITSVRKKEKGKRYILLRLPISHPFSPPPFLPGELGKFWEGEGGKGIGSERWEDTIIEQAPIPLFLAQEFIFRTKGKTTSTISLLV